MVVAHEEQGFVRIINLTQSRHVNIGWIVNSHPEYVKQALVTQDLKRRMDVKVVRFELLPHFITHTTAEGTKITTNALKIRVEYDYRQELFTGLLTCFRKGNKDDRRVSMSNTAGWKLIPFANNTLSRDQMTALVRKQNKYLYDVYVISHINLGSLKGNFFAVDALCKGSKRKTADDTPGMTTATGDQEMEKIEDTSKGGDYSASDT